MKKIIAFSILIFLLLSVSRVYAQTPTQEQRSDYELPYPGLLPDHPLYLFRIIRDRTVGFLIADPRKKAEFNLLQADKRLNAGIYLFDKGKIELSISTVSKAENYFGEALDKIDEAKKQGMDVSEFKKKLEVSSRKHQEELSKLVKKADKNYKQNFEKELKRAIDFDNRLNQLVLSQ